MTAHNYVLSFGSNISAEINLRQSLRSLAKIGSVVSRSTVWESPAHGSPGPNYLNFCASFQSERDPEQLSAELHAIEQSLGRMRGLDKNAPRPLDIDIVLIEQEPMALDHWHYDFVIVPLAELNPDLMHPQYQRRLAEIAAERQRAGNIKPRPDIIL